MVTYAWRQSCFSSDVARVSYERKTLCLTTLFRWSIEGVGQESRGRGTEEWMLTLTLPPKHLPFLKVAKKSYFQKRVQMCQYIHKALCQLFIWKIQGNRGVEVNLGFASASVPRKKSPAASFVSQKFQHSMLQKFLLASFMSLKIRSQLFMNWCYMIFSFPFYFPKNPHSTPGSWKIGFTMEFQIRPGALVPSLWGMFNKHATRKLRCRQQYEPPKSYIFICFN